MSTNNTVQLNIATANTSKATKDVKSLKEQIKDLRNEMAGLTKGTAEYDQAAAQLGDLMHQQAEITEAAKLATADYGQTLSNITSISAGVVGSLSAMNGVMNLIGASSDEAAEAMRKIQSLMAIVQGLNQLDQAEKAFKGLWTRIKLTTTARQNDTQETIKNTASATANATATNVDAAAKRKDAVASGVATAANNTLSMSFRKLGLAMKSFMASNPFTLLIMGATTLVSIISTLVAKTDEEAEKLNEAADNARKMMLNLSGEYAGGLGATSFEKRALGRGSYKLMRQGYEKRGFGEESYEANFTLNPKDEKAFNSFIAEIGIAKDQMKGLNKETKTYKDLLDFVYTDQQKIQYGQITWYESVKETLERLPGDEAKEKIEEVDEALNNLYTNLNQVEVEYKNELNKIAEDTKTEQEKALANAKKAADERRARELNDLKTAYERQKLLTNDLYRDQELTAEEYYDRQISELNGYLEKWTKLRVKHNKELGKRGLKDGLTAEDLLEIERMNSQAVDLERKKTEAIIELRKKLADSENYRGARATVNESRYQNAQNALIDQEGGRYAEQQEELFNAWWLKKFMLIEQYDKQEVEKEREHNDELNRLAMERYAEEERVLKENRRDDEEYEVTRFQNEMKALKERLEAKLISEQDYRLKEEELAREHMEKMAEIESGYNTDWQEIEANRTATLRDIAQQRYDIEKDYYERRMELDEEYINAYQTLSSSIGGILSKVQEQYSEGSRQYEKIQEASIIMDTVSGALSAFMSGVKSGIPAPGNFIYAGVLSALALAEGQLALNNLHSKRLSAGAANAPSVSAYQTVAYETGADLQGEIRDQRVVVLEQDITDTVNRVNVIESESTF